MSGARALLAAILFFCAAASLGGVFAWRALRAERRLRQELYGRYGPEISLLDELSTRLSREAGAVSTDEVSVGYRVFAKAGILLARARGDPSKWTFRLDQRVSFSAEEIVRPLDEGVAVRRLALPLRNGGSLDAVAAAWKVCAGQSCEEVVCEFAVEARSLAKP